MKCTKEWPTGLRNTVEDSVRRLDAWLEKNGWAGYDPFDIQGTRFYRRLARLPSTPGLLPWRALRWGIVFCERRYPLLARKIFMVRRQMIPKAMGLFGRAYLDLYEVTREERFRDKALQCLGWLQKHPSPGYSGLCWGLPFDWETVILIPCATPCATVSAIAGDAFWRAFEVFGDVRFLRACQSVCAFLADDLHIEKTAGGTICFSYTPIDRFCVHNANLFVAEFLTRVGKQVGNARYLELGRRAASYAVQEQNPDGSLYYWGKVQRHYSPEHIDHFHAGFEIRMLYNMWKLTGEERYWTAVSRYYRFYRERLFWKDCVPKFSPDRIYPIDVHSCSEAMLCNTALASEFEEARELLPRVVSWTIANMQTRDGWFVANIEKRGGRERKTRVPYIRWGQAWMLGALGQTYSLLSRRAAPQTETEVGA